MIYPENMVRAADFSSCGKYRYTLRRTWDVTLPRALFVLLNPSTADHQQDDPTIRRAIGYALHWGCGMVTFCNLFAFRATDPRRMMKWRSPNGPDSDAWLAYELATHELAKRDVIVAAWGTKGRHLGRGDHVRYWYREWQCLGINNDGTPKHILYLKAEALLRPWPSQP